MKGKVALVTGAASGIGAATSIALARRGAEMVLMADTNQVGLDATAAECEAAGAKVMKRLCDVTDRAAVEAFAEEFHRSHAAVDLLVNNAGVSVLGRFLETPLEDWKWVLDVNVWGYLHFLHAFVPRMVARRQGHIVNVSSAAAFVPMDSTIAYSTSKAAIVAMSEALRTELAPHGVGVTVVCPGIVNTGMVHSSRRRGRAEDPAVQERMVEFFAKKGARPETAAEEICKAVQANLGVAPIAQAAPVYYMKRFIPKLASWIARSMEQRVVRPPRKR